MRGKGLPNNILREDSYTHNLKSTTNAQLSSVTMYFSVLMLSAFLCIFLKWKILWGGCWEKVGVFPPINFTPASHKYHIRIAEPSWNSGGCIYLFYFHYLYGNSVVCTEKHWACFARISLWGSVLLFKIFVYIGSVVTWLKPELAMATCCLKRLDTWKLQAWLLPWLHHSLLLAPGRNCLSYCCLPLTMNILHTSHNYKN